MHIAEEVRDEEPGCFTWKWTKTNFTVCPPHTKDRQPTMCSTYGLGRGAPEINTDAAGRKVGRGSRSGSGTELLVAHFTVTRLEAVEVRVVSGQEKITNIDATSAAGLLSVLVVTVASWVLVWLLSFWARRRWGYGMRLHTYSGLAAYAASLEDRYCVDAEKTARCSFGCEAMVSFEEPDDERLGEKIYAKQRPHIRLREGSGRFAGLVSIGQNSAGSGI